MSSTFHSSPVTPKDIPPASPTGACGGPPARIVPLSVVIPCYKCAETIHRAVESIARQSALPGEVILVDDFSNDGTLDTLEGIKRAYPTGWIKVVALGANGGPAVARNSGWEVATQPYMAFLDSDDAWHRNKVEIQFDWLSANPKAMIVGHDCLQLKPGREAGALTGRVVALRVYRFQLLVTNSFSVRTAMLRSDLPIRFDASKRYMEDHWWLLQISFAGIDIYKISLPLAFTFKSDYGEQGLSRDLWRMEREELDNYRRLRARGLIAWPLASLIYCYSFAKYLRRVLISTVRRLAAQ